MAPSGNAIPQRFRQRPSPTPNRDSKEMNGKWEELLDRRQRCKERYNNIKRELQDATESLTKIDQNKNKAETKTPLIKLDAFSFIPVAKNEKSSKGELARSSRNIDRNSNIIESISSRYREQSSTRSQFGSRFSEQSFGDRKSNSRLSDHSSNGFDFSSRFSDRNSRDLSDGTEYSRSSRATDQSSDRFGSRFSSLAREPSSDRKQFGSRFTEHRTISSRNSDFSTKAREESHDRSQLQSRFSSSCPKFEPYKSSKSSDFSSKYTERNSRGTNTSPTRTKVSPIRAQISPIRSEHSPIQNKTCSDFKSYSSPSSKTLLDFDRKIEEIVQNVRDSRAKGLTNGETCSSARNTHSSAHKESTDEGSRVTSMMSSAHSFEATKYASNSRTLVDKVARNVDVPAGTGRVRSLSQRTCAFFRYFILNNLYSGLEFLFQSWD